MKNEYRWGWRLETLLPLTQAFAYIDAREHLADHLLAERHIKTNIKYEYGIPDTPYVIILCRCRKRDAGQFTEAMSELENKMLICGYSDYPEFAEKVISEINAAAPGRKGGFAA